MNKITAKDVEEYETGNGSLNTFQELATRTAIYPGQGSTLGLMYCALKLNGEAGELAEHVGKALRDDQLMSGREQLTIQRHNLIVKEVGDCLWYLSALCNELGITLNLAAKENLTKLADRSHRGKLGGSGDER